MRLWEERITRDQGRPMRPRKKRYRVVSDGARTIQGGIVVAVAAITGIWLTDVDTVWIWTIVAVYLFGCVGAGAGLVDDMLNERRTAKRDRLVELGLYNPVKDSHLPAAEPDQPGLIQRLISAIMSVRRRGDALATLFRGSATDGAGGTGGDICKPSSEARAVHHEFASLSVKAACRRRTRCPEGLNCGRS